MSHAVRFICILVIGTSLVHAQTEEGGTEEDSQDVREPTPSSQLSLEESQSFFNGSARYRYPIVVAPGTGGLAPSIALSYASQTKWSSVGFGWSLSGLDAIKRSSKCGVPTLDDRDAFTWRGQTLVADAQGVYHTEKEGFARVERVGEGALSSWVVTKSDGMKYHYGTSDNSRVMTHESADIVHRWALDRVEDANGNYYTVSYVHDDNSAAYYPQTITYTYNDRGSLSAYRTVEFTWQSRPDVRTSYSEGTRRTLSQRLAHIDTKVDGVLDKRHVLTYTLGAGGKSLLSAIRVVGSDSEMSLPPTTFRYAGDKREFGEEISYGGGMGYFMSESYNGATKMLIDINGDGLTDEVGRLNRLPRGVRSVPFQIRLHNGAGFDEPIEWEGATDSLAVTTVHSHKQALYAIKLMMDMDGDGRPDIVERNINRSREPGNYMVYLNTGAGFAPAADWGPGEARFVMDTDGRAFTTKLLMDINGDGLPDELYRPYQPKVTARPGRRKARPEIIYNLQVRLNTGSGFGEAQDWGTMQGKYLKDKDHRGNTYHELIDINGDGLPDDLYRPFVPGGTGRPDQFSNLFVRLNTGRGFGPVEDWGTMQGNVLRDSHGTMTIHDLIDINGDGLLDDVYRPSLNVRTYKPLDHYLVRLNTGSGFGPVQSWGTGLGRGLSSAYRGQKTNSLMDINGDGLPDSVFRSYRATGPRGNSRVAQDYQVRLNQAGPPSLLSMVQLPEGGRITYEYGVSTQFDNTDYTGTPRLSNKIRVVTAITRDDALAGVHTSRITYRGGLYEGYPTCEFRGFREVVVTDATGAKTRTSYLQDDIGWGNANSKARLNAAEDLLSLTESEWSFRAIDEQRGIVFPYVERERTSTYDGADTPRVTEKHYEYDEYGNPTQVTDSGDVAIDGDEVRTRADYAVNTTAWIVNAPSRKIVEDKVDGDWKVARETVTYYDDSSHGSVSRGNPTQIDTRIDATRVSTVRTGYDVFGNVVWSRDGNANASADWPVNTLGHTSDRTYDDVFHTVVVAERNALDHVTRHEYDDQLRRVVTEDANGNRTTTTYDALGRATAIAKPGDVTPSVVTTYERNGIAPEYNIERTRQVNDEWLVSYALVDGFGRAIQTKVPSGDQFVAVDQYYDALGRRAADSQGYRVASIVNTDPADQITDEEPLVVVADQFANVVANDDGSLTMPGWTRFGAGEMYYGETGTWTPPSGVNGGAIEFKGADRDTRELVLADNNMTVGVESELDLSQWNGRSLMFSAQYGGEYTVHKRDVYCRWIGGRKQCWDRSKHNLGAAPVMLTVLDASTDSVLVETELPNGTLDRLDRHWWAAHELDLTDAVAGAKSIRVRLWMELPSAGQDISSYGFRVRNIRLEGHTDVLRGIVVRDTTQPMTRTEHDALGRVVAQVTPDGTAVTTTYDRGTRTVVNGNGSTITQRLDTYERIAAIDETIDGAVHTTFYQHRPATGELEQVTDAKGNVYSSVFDMAGRKTVEYDADRGEWLSEYDANGNVIVRTDANQQTSNHRYDALNRLVERGAHDGHKTVYEYDVGANGIGMVAAIATDDFRREFGYDARGRTVNETLMMDGHTWVTKFAHNDADQLITMTYPDGEQVKTDYDARGFVASVSGEDSYVLSTGYADHGRLTALKYGNGTQLSYTYYDGGAPDPLSGSAHSYRLRSITADGGTVELDLEYQYDKIGNVMTVLDKSNAEHSQFFAYDSVDRLVSASGVYGERTYLYDAVGNVLGFDNRTYQYGVGNRLENDGRWQYVYDDNGNVVSRTQGETVQKYTFDALNRMTRLEDGAVETYVYNEGETRLKKTADGKTTYYITKDYEEVWSDGAAIETVKHYRSGEQKVATRDEDGLKYIYPDQLQSSSRMADADGNQVKAIWYMPFGGDAKELGDAKARYRFTGKEKDDSGLYYYGARYYDDALGRFMAADSILPDVYDPQQLNRFAYVRNNPVKLVDPDGHAANLVLGALGAAFGAGITAIGYLGGIAYESVVTGENKFEQVTSQQWADMGTQVAVNAFAGFLVGVTLGATLAVPAGVVVAGAGAGGMGMMGGFGFKAGVDALIDGGVELAEQADEAIEQAMEPEIPEGMSAHYENVNGELVFRGFVPDPFAGDEDDSAERTPAPEERDDDDDDDDDDND